MFTLFRQSGAKFRSRWIAALISVNPLIVNAWSFSVFTSAKNFWKISLKSDGLSLSVLRSTVHDCSFRTPFSSIFTLLTCSHGVFRLSFFSFCSISSSCWLCKCEFWIEKRLKFGASFSSFQTELQGDKQNSRQLGIEMVSSCHWPIEVVKLGRSQHPIRVRAANTFTARSI